jgi:hypothetical protein
MRPTLFFSALLSLFFSFLFTPARADHALPFNPSFYPHEIQIKTVDLISAKRLLSNNSLHAYIGGNPFAGGETPPHLGYVESFDSYLVATFNLASKPWKEREARCAAAGPLVSAMATNKGDYIFHPYPVTPFHEDYLQHFDLAESARNRYRTESNQMSAVNLKISAKGSVAEKIVHSMSRIMEKGGDATVEEIGAENLVSSQRIQLNAWLGPPWLKEGWFQSYLLLARTVADVETKRTVDSTYLRLVTGGYDNTVQRVNLERRLVSRLMRDCTRVVLGYTVKREYFNNSDYSEGVEDIARDSQSGFNSPIFIRTVKLKDFPWNGWLRLGIAAKPSAAWNPIGGFSDTAGRFIWSAVGDPAVLPAPDKSNWIPNRVMSTLIANDAARSNVAIEVPKDALTPDPETGELRPVVAGTTAKAKIIYRVLSSSFHDKTSLTVADLLYNFSFAYRWSSRNPRSRNQYDPLVDTSTASARELLAGFRAVRIDTDVKDFGDMKFTFKVPVIELFVTRMLADRQHVASVAPPWSSLPWHLMALMEETVKRGWAAFSADEAKRRRVSWLDIVRDQKIKDRMAGLVDRFLQQKYVPAVLKTFVSPAEAESRWSALKQFYKRRGHFLVTNGPYELVRWSGDTIVFQAFRDPTYPVGMGSFEQYTLPLRAYVSKVEIRGGRLEIIGEAENVFRFQRSYRIVREPLGRADSSAQIQRPVLCRYVIVGPAGDVLNTGIADQGEAGKFTVDLKGKLPPGLHTVVVALYEGENFVDPKIKIMRHRVEAGS